MNRTVYFDYLRVFASICIMIVHVAAYPWYYVDINSNTWLVLEVYKCINRAPVLLFIMISGALFLGREIPVRKMYSKYILRMVIAFIFWDIVYAVITYWDKGISGIIFKLFNSNYHLWFLLAIIGLYMLTPFLRLIAENEKILRYFLILALIFAFIIPNCFSLIESFGNETMVKYADMLGGHIYDMHVEAVIGYPFYFLAGYYIHTHELGKISRRIIYVLGICGVIFGVVLNVYYSRSTGVLQDSFHNVFMTHEMVEAIALFTFFRYNVKGTPKLDGIVYKISACGFGAYLMHDLVILGLEKFLGLNAISFPSIIAVPVLGVLTFAVSSALAWVLGRIPFVKKYLV